LAPDVTTVFLFFNHQE